MQTFKLTIEYDGSKYSGWQSQINARTVQGELQRVADELFGSKVEIQGAGRTDAGVHALGQVAHIKVREARRKFVAPQLMRDLNDKLPATIAIGEVEEMPAKFHARHDAVSRTYFYQVSTRKTALAKKFVWWVKDPLDLAKMQAAAGLIAGRHDFTAFAAADPSRPGESTIVVVDAAEVGEAEHLVVFRIEASHFLWRMVRRLAGTLVKVGMGDVTVEQFRALIEEGKNPKLDVPAWTAPSSGLFLESVRY